MPDISLEDLKPQLTWDRPVVVGIRKATPGFFVPLLASVRARRGKKKASMRDMARKEVTFLLGDDLAPAELERLIDGYIEQWYLRAELRWRLDTLMDLELKGLDKLKAARDSGRGVVLNFIHHAQFEGVIGALAKQGVPQTVFVSDDYFTAKIADTRRQLLHGMLLHGNKPYTVAGGMAEIGQVLAEGRVISMATDVPGRSPMHFLGKDRTCSSGAARLAAGAGAYVVAITVRRDAQGKAYGQLSDPMDPRDFETPEALLEAMVRYHEDAVKAWPEAYDSPSTRWGTPEPA